MQASFMCLAVKGQPHIYPADSVLIMNMNYLGNLYQWTHIGVTLPVCFYACHYGCFPNNQLYQWLHQFIQTHFIINLDKYKSAHSTYINVATIHVLIYALHNVCTLPQGTTRMHICISCFDFNYRNIVLMIKFLFFICKHWWIYDVFINNPSPLVILLSMHMSEHLTAPGSQMWHRW